MTHYESIASIIRSADVPSEAKEAVLASLAQFQDADLAEVAALLAEDVTLAPRLVKNFQAKQATIALGDSAMWTKIVQAEELELEVQDKE